MTPESNNNVDILFVSNDRVERSLIEGFVNAGKSIKVAYSYDEAESYLQQHTPEVTICDAELRGVDVRKICRELITKPCVFVSSRDKDTERRKCLLQLRECYLTRPYSQDQLLNAISVARNSYKPKGVMH